jgi:hypothetical protein
MSESGRLKMLPGCGLVLVLSVFSADSSGLMESSSRRRSCDAVVVGGVIESSSRRRSWDEVDDCCVLVRRQRSSRCSHDSCRPLLLPHVEQTLGIVSCDGCVVTCT